jgi:hypothetical protein
VNRGDGGRKRRNDAGVLVGVRVANVRFQVCCLRKVTPAQPTVERPDSAVRQNVTLQF